MKFKDVIQRIQNINYLVKYSELVSVFMNNTVRRSPLIFIDIMNETTCCQICFDGPYN